MIVRQWEKIGRRHLSTYSKRVWRVAYVKSLLPCPLIVEVTGGYVMKYVFNSMTFGEGHIFCQVRPVGYFMRFYFLMESVRHKLFEARTTCMHAILDMAWIIAGVVEDTLMSFLVGDHYAFH